MVGIGEASSLIHHAQIAWLPAAERRRYALSGPPPPDWFTDLRPAPWITPRVLAEGRKLAGASLVTIPASPVPALAAVPVPPGQQAPPPAETLSGVPPWDTTAAPADAPADPVTERWRRPDHRDRGCRRVPRLRQARQLPPRPHPPPHPRRNPHLRRPPRLDTSRPPRLARPAQRRQPRIRLTRIACSPGFGELEPQFEHVGWLRFPGRTDDLRDRPRAQTRAHGGRSCLNLIPEYREKPRPGGRREREHQAVTILAVTHQHSASRGDFYAVSPVTA